jgi:hypothetical protein
LQAILNDLKSGKIKAIGRRTGEGTWNPPGPKAPARSNAREGGLSATFRVG